MRIAEADYLPAQSLLKHLKRRSAQHSCPSEASWRPRPYRRFRRRRSMTVTRRRNRNRNLHRMPEVICQSMIL